MCKTLRKKIREDCRQFKIKEIKEAIQENKSLKKGKRKMAEGAKQISCLLNKQGHPITNQEDILRRIEEFYTELYSSNNRVQAPDMVGGNFEIPVITQSEVRSALQQMANDKAVGPDGISVEELKAGGSTIHQQLATLYTACLQKNQIPATWKQANMILIHKKGDNRNLKNYRPISLLSNIYKLFTKILTRRLQTQLDENQPVEQAGFRSGFSTTDHIHTINQLIEKCAEYQKPLCLAFVDYEKAFDSVETNAVLTSLKNQGIDSEYISTIAEIYREGNSVVKLNDTSNKIPLCKGVRQGDTISPKLFTASLEDIFKKLDWENRGVSIHGKKLNNLRFADDVALIGESVQQIEMSLNELASESRKVGLKINMEKTKVLRNKHTDSYAVKMDGNEIEEVESYIYLGQKISLKEGGMSSEIDRRIYAGWRVYNENKFLFESNIPNSLKRKLHNQCIVPAMTYGCETWSMTKMMERKLAATQRKMERSMLGVKWDDMKTNEWIRSQTKVKDILETVKERKWKWAGHVARMKDKRWTVEITDWRPMDGKRGRGRPRKRWRDEIDWYWGSVAWKEKAQNRAEWKLHAEAFIQHVD